MFSPAVSILFKFCYVLGRFFINILPKNVYFSRLFIYRIFKLKILFTANKKFPSVRNFLLCPDVAKHANVDCVIFFTIRSFEIFRRNQVVDGV